MRSGPGADAVLAVQVIVKAAGAGVGEALRQLGLAGVQRPDAVLDCGAGAVRWVWVGRDLVRARVVVDEGHALADGDGDLRRADACPR